MFDQSGIESISSTLVSDSNKKLGQGFEHWKNRVLEEFPYLILNAICEKLRLTGIVRDVAGLTAFGVGQKGNRRILVVKVKLKDAQHLWWSS